MTGEGGGGRGEMRAEGGSRIKRKGRERAKEDEEGGKKMGAAEKNNNLILVFRMFKEVLKLPLASTRGYLTSFCLKIIHQVLQKLVEAYCRLQLSWKVR
jgi:hypothetical protein